MGGRMERVTIKQLRYLVDYINRRTDSKFFIDHYSPGGNPYTYHLAETTEGGGERPTTNYRMTAREFKAYLNGIIDTVDYILVQEYK